MHGSFVYNKRNDSNILWLSCDKAGCKKSFMFGLKQVYLGISLEHDGMRNDCSYRYALKQGIIPKIALRAFGAAQNRAIEAVCG